MSHEEIDPILPPEGSGHVWRYESADLDIKALQQYLLDTSFEDEAAVVIDLSDRYNMKRRMSLADIEMNMTREYKGVAIDGLIDEQKGEPLAHEEPVEVLQMPISTQDERLWHLRIYSVPNGGGEIRFEYIFNNENI
jgi:hypothetical protein